MDENGQIYAILSAGDWRKTVASGTVEKLELLGNIIDCRRATLAFRRLGDDAPSAKVESVGSFDGKWLGQANLVKQTLGNTSAPACMNRLKLDLQISDSTVTGFVKGLRASSNGSLSGVIDASGNFEGRGVAGHPLKLHGSLSADTGAGSGVWSTTHCEGTFEIARQGGAQETAAIDETPTARRDTVSSDAASALARFDGTWTGKGILITQTNACPGTIVIEMQVSDGEITGFQTMTTGLKSGWGHLSGAIDASGRLETYGPKYRLRGALSADTGRGSGEWLNNSCQGNFELARVE
jgi:hypothetical protein